VNIWQFYQSLSRRLFAINVINIVIGVVLRRRGPDFWRGVGTQAVGWGFINILIAIFGQIGTNRRQNKLENPDDPAIRRKEAKNIRRVLLINAGLDILYMLAGYRTAQSDRGQRDSSMRGMGWGIVFQGLLLFVFDLVQAAQVPKQKD
jgi:hypothetical protein